MTVLPSAPAVARLPGLPEAVTVFEVGPRDGLQSELSTVPTAVKLELCRRLIAAGVPAIEATSFVPPGWIPQLADAEAVMDGLDTPIDTPVYALVTNERGLDRAQSAGVRSISVVVSATESFAAANLNATRETALARATALVARAGRAGLATRGYVSMSFGDPWEGAVPPTAAAEMGAELAAAGCERIVLSDTTGVATPGAIAAVVAGLNAAGVSPGFLALHLHDTYALAAANVVEGLRNGVHEFDSAAGGLGRCPYAPGAAGNLATEDLVWLLNGLGIQTGVNLDAVIDTTAWLAESLGSTPASRVARAVLRQRAASTATTHNEFLERTQ